MVEGLNFGHKWHAEEPCVILFPTVCIGFVKGGSSGGFMGRLGRVGTLDFMLH